MSSYRTERWGRCGAAREALSACAGAYDSRLSEGEATGAEGERVGGAGRFCRAQAALCQLPSGPEWEREFCVCS
jgi:hypothetical protein